MKLINNQVTGRNGRWEPSPKAGMDGSVLIWHPLELACDGDLYTTCFVTKNMSHR